MGVNGGPNIVTDGLVLHLDAANTKSYPGSGTLWKDLSGLGNDGSLVGPTFNSAEANFSFDGVDDYASFGNVSSIKNLSQGTINIWFKPSSTSMSFLLGWHGTIADYFRLEVTANNTTRFLSEVGNVTDTVTSISSSPLNEFTNISITQDGVNSKIYFNGAREGGLGNSTWFGTHPTLSLYLGHELSWTGYFYTGSIALTTIYNKALTSAEILQNFRATRSRFGV